MISYDSLTTGLCTVVCSHVNSWWWFQSILEVISFYLLLAIYLSIYLQLSISLYLRPPSIYLSTSTIIRPLAIYLSIYMLPPAICQSTSFIYLYIYVSICNLSIWLVLSLSSYLHLARYLVSASFVHVYNSTSI